MPENLADAVAGHRREALFVATRGAGLRILEALGLSWPDVDLATGRLTVRKQLQRLIGQLTLTEPKSRSGRRSVILPAVAVDALRAHRLRQPEERLGHASIAITLDTYSHVLPSMQEQAAEGIDRALFGV